MGEIARNKAQIIVIENSPTIEIYNSLKKRETELLKIYYCKDAGLSNARNFGASRAIGEYLIFLDDDAFPEKGWLDSYSDFIKRNETSVDILAGRIIPYYSSGKRPHWLPSNFEWIYGRLEYGSHIRPLNSKEVINGGNFCIRRSTFDELNGFNTMFGHVANQLGGGEEQNLLDRYRKVVDRPIYYIPGASVVHKFDENRLTLDWAKKRVSSATVHSHLRDLKNKPKYIIFAKICSYFIRFPFVDILAQEQYKTYLKCARRSFLRDDKSKGVAQ